MNSEGSDPVCRGIIQEKELGDLNFVELTKLNVNNTKSSYDNITALSHFANLKIV